MSKTKTAKPITNLQLFNRTNGLKSINLKGRTALASINVNKNGDVDLTLKSDNTKADKTEVQQLKEDVLSLQTQSQQLTLTSNYIKEQSLVKRECLGNITTDKYNYNFITLDYEKDYSSIPNVFTNSSEYTTTMKLSIEVKYDYKGTTKSYIINSTVGTPSKNGTSHYSIFTLLPIGKMIVTGYDQKYKTEYKNTFNLALELLLPPVNKFTDKSFLTTKNVLININSDMLVKNKETIFNITDDNINSISITPKSFIIEQTITNAYLELMRKEIN